MRLFLKIFVSVSNIRDVAMTKPEPSMADLIEQRFGDPQDPLPDMEGQNLLSSMLGRGSCRSFEDRSISDELLNVLVAAALASPTKSDLQQRDIILIKSPTLRRDLSALVSGQAWVADAPMIAVFCGNNRRQRLLHDWAGVPFANHHLDAFFNASVDAAIALGAFVTAAEALGMGCCPISAVRNEADEVSKLLKLPDHVFPVAGLALGYPSGEPELSMRLPLKVTCHWDAYAEDNLEPLISAYDEERRLTQPYQNQRLKHAFGESNTYGWVEDKVRQYSQPERETFGKFVRSKGFSLD